LTRRNGALYSIRTSLSAPRIESTSPAWAAIAR
jgi:hypothetical protein